MVQVPLRFCSAIADCCAASTDPTFVISEFWKLKALTPLTTTPICELPSMKIFAKLAAVPIVCRKIGPLQFVSAPVETSAVQPAATVDEFDLKYMLFSVTVLTLTNSAPRAVVL